jgi:prepilin-type N-terminal cleavage/methylation domain-containing protein
MKPGTFEKGFTLVELVVAMTASLIVLGAIVTTFYVQSQSYRNQQQIVEMQENARAGMDMMCREFLMAGYMGTGSMPSTDVPGEDFSDNRAEYIEEADANHFTFQADIDGDNTVETVRYTWSGTPGDPLRREVWKWNGSGAWGGSAGAQPLAENIQDLRFEYDYHDGEVDRANIQRITIHLTARTKRPDPRCATNGGHRTIRLTSDVTPRNLML